MTTYICNDGNGEMTIEADSAREAAQEYVDDGSWGEIESTTWINVNVSEVSEDEDGERELEDLGRYKISIDPDEPDCDSDEHDWQSPHEILGGIKESPGVRGHGGGVIVREVCMHCGCERVTDTWAQDRQDGRQGLTSIQYEPGKYADDLASMREEEDA